MGYTYFLIILVHTRTKLTLQCVWNESVSVAQTLENSLLPHHKTARLTFAEKLQKWNIEQLKKVLFFDHKKY